MKTLRLIGIVLECCLICGTGFCQEKKYQEGDFNKDGVVDEFEKSLLERGINPEFLDPYPPSPISDTPIPILINYKKEKGEFSKYLFTTDMEGETDSCRLAKEANFQAASFIQFNTTQTEVFGTPEEKAKNLDRFKLEGIIYWELEAQEPHTEKEITGKLDAMLKKIDALEQKYPGFKINVFLFGNEPDFPGNWHWKGTPEQFCENYTIFVRHLKSKNKDYIVGAPGFAPTQVFPPHIISEWPEKLVKYLHEQDVPLDFLSFHSYGRGLKKSIHERLEYLNQLLDKYPVQSPVFGRPKIANNEFDTLSHPVTETRYSLSTDSAWRPAHNILAILYMMENDVWLASEWSGPFAMARNEHRYDVDLAWIKKDGTIKPVYYGHKLLNNLAGTIRLAQEGSNFQTFRGHGRQVQRRQQHYHCFSKL